MQWCWSATATQTRRRRTNATLPLMDTCCIMLSNIEHLKYLEIENTKKKHFGRDVDGYLKHLETARILIFFFHVLSAWFAPGLLVHPQFLGRRMGRKRIHPLGTPQ